MLGLKRVEELPRQWLAALTVLVAVGIDAAWGGWPFQSHPKPLGAYKDPTVWQLLLSDRLTVGFVRLAFIGLVLYIVVSVPALVVAGRWLKGFGTSGLTADDAHDAAKTISRLQTELDLTTRKLEAVNAQVAQLTEQRDALREAVRQAVEGDRPATRRRRKRAE